MIKAWWAISPKPGNFGDILTPYIVKKLTGKDATFRPHTRLRRGDLLCVGSVLKFARDGVNVWGTGIMSKEHHVNTKAVYHAVRGPLTREAILKAGGECPEIYGDPALLLPMFYKPKFTKKYKFGIIPHYCDYGFVCEQMKDNPEIKVINIIGSDIHGFIDAMAECENIVSSSLHGLIAAHAYGLKAAWVEFSDKLNPDGSKFPDYAASVGIDMPVNDLRDSFTAEQIKSLNFVESGKFDAEKLLMAFPYPLKLEWLKVCRQTFAS